MPLEDAAGYTGEEKPDEDKVEFDIKDVVLELDEISIEEEVNDSEEVGRDEEEEEEEGEEGEENDSE
jgi:hypothetical protein